MEYTILTTGIEEWSSWLIKKVNAYIVDWWEPIWWVSMTDDFWAQAMVKYDPYYDKK